MQQSSGHRFRKIPVEVEARRVPASGASDLMELARWCQGTIVAHHGAAIAIETLEGTMVARPGDWIICGVAGEFYPCKPDVFEATYEAA